MTEEEVQARLTRENLAALKDIRSQVSISLLVD
jgi:hypothetical protein